MFHQDGEDELFFIVSMEMYHKSTVENVKQRATAKTNDKLAKLIKLVEQNLYRKTIANQHSSDNAQRSKPKRKFISS